MSESKKPHAEWFPSHIAGMHRLSKAEVAEDLDFILQSTPSEAKLAAAMAAASAKVGGGPAAAAAVAAAKRKALKDARAGGDVASKRTRLNDKIDREKKSLVGIKTTHTALRRDLEAVRAEITQYRDAIATTEREIVNAVRERKALEENYTALREDYTQSMHTGETSRIEYERSLRELGARLQQQSQLANEAAQRLHELQSIEQDMKDRDRQIEELKQTVASKDLHLKAISELGGNSAAAAGAAAAASTATAAAAASTPAEVAAACEKVGLTAPPAGATIDWTRAYIERLEAAERDARQMKIKAEEEEARQKEWRKQLETVTEESTRRQQLISELSAQEKLNTQLLSEEREVSARLNAETERLTKLKLEHEQMFHKQEDKFIAQNEILAVADKRAIEAELTLREVVTEIAVLRNGNRLLQFAYNRLLDEVKALEDVRGGLVEELTESQTGITDLQDSSTLARDKLIALRTKLATMTADNDHLKLILAYTNDATNNDKQQIKRMAHEIDTLSRTVMEYQNANFDDRFSHIAAATGGGAAANPTSSSAAAAAGASATNAAVSAASSASSSSSTAAASTSSTAATATAAASGAVSNADAIHAHRRSVQALYMEHADKLQAGAGAAGVAAPTGAAAAAMSDEAR